MSHRLEDRRERRDGDWRDGDRRGGVWRDGDHRDGDRREGSRRAEDRSDRRDEGRQGEDRDRDRRRDESRDERSSREEDRPRSNSSYGVALIPAPRSESAPPINLSLNMTEMLMRSVLRLENLLTRMERQLDSRDTRNPQPPHRAAPASASAAAPCAPPGPPAPPVVVVQHQDWKQCACIVGDGGGGTSRCPNTAPINNDFCKSCCRAWTEAQGKGGR